MSEADSAKPLAEGEIDKGDGHAGETYDPGQVEATRLREQGIGVGQKDLNQQRDPTRADNGRP